jgi:ribosomal protein S18 acetylase RimI-like enzyme
VHEVRAEEVSAVFGALARAFEDDPVTAFLFPDVSSRIDRLLSFYRVTTPWLTEGGRFFTDAGLCGGAIWQAPRPARVGAARTLLRLLRTGLVLRGRARAGLVLAQAIESTRVPQPHWYLGILGTQPEDQGRGIGSELIEPILEVCDRAREIAYLESSKAANIPFYERHGFEVTAEIEVPRGPVLWSMVRQPQGGRA